MGLDSVELLMEIENYFNIRIPDPEAEKIYTVQLMVDSVAKHLAITEDSTELRDEIFKKVNDALFDMGIISTPLKLTDKVVTVLPKAEKALWSELSQKIGLDLAELEIASGNQKTFIEKLLPTSWSPMYNEEELTFSQFVDAICAKNYNKLIDPHSIKNTYEIYVAVSALQSLKSVWITMR